MERGRSPVQPTAVPTAPYTARPPSPPYIHVPTVTYRPGSTGNRSFYTNQNLSTTTTTTTTTTKQATTTLPPPRPPGADFLMYITPCPWAVAALPSPPHLTQADLAAITSGLAPQTASDPAARQWAYEARRAAQPVLDYLYLGPASAARDAAGLVREGITMVLAARDARFLAAPGAVVVGGARARELEAAGIAVESVVIGGGAEGGGGGAEGCCSSLVGAFDLAAARINQHLLGVVRGSSSSGGKGVGEEPGRRGKVLVCCETGNDRSAAVVASYLMAMYGLDTVRAVQFVQLQRFCVTLGDDVKFLLQAYGDILQARRDVARMAVEEGPGAGLPTATATQSHGQTQFKRRIGETRTDDDDGDEVMGEMDEERYWNRDFAPFVDA